MNSNSALITELNKKIDQYLETGEYEKIEEASRELCRLQGLDMVDKMPDSFLSQMKKKERKNMSIMKGKRNRREKGEEGKETRTFSISRAGFAVCVLCAAIIISVPVAAKVNSAVTERMEKMSKKEQQELLDANDSHNMTRDHDTEALRYSRELSDKEEARYKELSEKYKQEGLFPEGELPIVDKLEEDEEITDPVYEIWNREIFMPERELTDEEILQIIDYCEKSSYAILNSDDSKKYRKAQEEFDGNPNPGENDLSEEEAISKASEYLEAMYDVDASAMEKTTEFWMGTEMENGKYGTWGVDFKGTDDWSYEVNITRETGRLVNISLCREGSFYGSWGRLPAPVDEELYTSVYKEAKNIINSIYPDTKIVRGTVAYTNDDGEAKDGFLEFDFETEDNYVITVQYIIEDAVFDYIWVTEGEWDEYTNSSWGDYLVIPME